MKMTLKFHEVTAEARGSALLQDVWLLEKLTHFDREVIPARRGRCQARHSRLRSRVLYYGAEAESRELLSHLSSYGDAQRYRRGVAGVSTLWA